MILLNFKRAKPNLFAVKSLINKSFKLYRLQLFQNCSEFHVNNYANISEICNNGSETVLLKKMLLNELSIPQM